MMIFVFVGFSAELVKEVETDWSSEEHQKEQKLSTAHSCLQGDTFLCVLILLLLILLAAPSSNIFL